MHENAATDEPLLTVRQAAEIANVSRPTLYRRIEQGEVVAVRVGNGHGLLRVPENSFRRWLFGEPDDGA